MCTRGEAGILLGPTLYITILTDSVRNGMICYNVSWCWYKQADKCLPHTLLHDTEGLGKKSNDVAGGLGGGGA